MSGGVGVAVLRMWWVVLSMHDAALVVVWMGAMVGDVCNGLALDGVGMKVQDGRRRSEGQAHRQFPLIWDKLFLSKEVWFLMSTESVNDPIHSERCCEPVTSMLTATRALLRHR